MARGNFPVNNYRMICFMADPRISQIERLLIESGKSVRWLASKVGSTDTTLHHILSGETRNPRDPGIIDRMLDALAEIPKSHKRITTITKQLRPIPVYTTIMAGEPGSYDADVEYEDIPEWGGEFKRWGRVVEGESMLPVLLPGDIAVFEDRQAESGSVVHAFADGDDCVKCYRVIDGVPMLASFNDEGPTFSASGWKAKGVCVARIRYGAFKIRHFTEFPGGLSWAMRHERSL